MIRVIRVDACGLWIMEDAVINLSSTHSNHSIGGDWGEKAKRDKILEKEGHWIVQDIFFFFFFFFFFAGLNVQWRHAGKPGDRPS
jgi:hypothetical protein